MDCKGLYLAYATYRTAVYVAQPKNDVFWRWEVVHEKRKIANFEAKEVIEITRTGSGQLADTGGDWTVP